MQRWSRPDRLSKKFDRETSNPFAKSSAARSNFAQLYLQGGVPCRVNHGAVFCRLQWDEDPSQLAYDPLIFTISDGLSEHQHPFAFIAQTAFKELMLAPNAKGKVTPLIPTIVRNLRKAMLSKQDAVFTATLEAIKELSECVQEALTPHFGSLLIQINRKAFEKKFKQPVFECLHTLASNGGPNAVKTIKLKIPAFSV